MLVKSGSAVSRDVMGPIDRFKKSAKKAVSSAADSSKLEARQRKVTDLANRGNVLLSKVNEAGQFVNRYTGTV